MSENIIKETFIREIPGTYGGTFKVQVEHIGFKPFKEQKNGLEELDEFLCEGLNSHMDIRGFIPYNNFECSVDWKVITEGGSQ